MKPILKAQYDLKERLWDCKWHPDKKIIACCGKKIHLIDSDEETKIGEHEKTIRKIAWNGDVLGAASFDSTVSLTNIKTNESISLEGHENEAKGISFSVDGTMVATCSRDKSVWIWEILDCKNLEVECMAVLQEHDQDVKHCIFHPFEDILISCSYDMKIKLYVVDSDDDWYCQDTFEEHKDTVWDFQFSENGRLAMSCDGSGLCILWQYRAGSLEYLDNIQLPHAAMKICWMDDICTVAAEQFIYFIRVDQDMLTIDDKLEHPHGIYDVNSMSIQKKEGDYWLASVGDDCKLKIWQITK
eukprot:NODE_76_length_23341_cov_0.477498.p7 type:complete len:300 gc:universal NODE_76_length_23341_cov_0.477498:11122-12021(+)